MRDFTFTFHFHALEKEMATHSSILAWRIPGMGEPGGLSSMGSQRVKHYIYICMYVYGLPWWSSGQESICECRRHKRHGSIPGSGRCPGGGHRNPLQYSCLENSRDRGAWSHKESDTAEHACLCVCVCVCARARACAYNILSQILFHMVYHRILNSPQCYTGGPCCLSILYTIVCILSRKVFVTIWR